MGNCDVGGLVKSHEAGQFGEDPCDKGVDCRWLREYGATDLDDWSMIHWVDTGDSEIGV